jgi:beta-1,4-mannosyl-glycoprotein beta-1,4-N-acetylglucosaminyltransferase
MKNIDAFLFNGEIITLLRLKYLSPVIDYFFISEKRYTYQGKRKNKLFIDIYKEWFYPYIEKCRFIVDETEPDSYSWKNEQTHRNSFYPVIKETLQEEEFIGVVSDADEIPNRLILTEDNYKMLEDGYYIFLTKEYYYNLNWHTTGIPAGTLFSDKMFNKLDKNTFHILRAWDLSKIENLPKDFLCKGMIQMSWHLSYFMTRTEIRRKIESFSHTECNKDEFKTDEHINMCIYEGEDLFKRDWFPPLKREDPNEQGFPIEFLQFHALLQEKQKE